MENKTKYSRLPKNVCCKKCGKCWVAGSEGYEKNDCNGDEEHLIHIKNDPKSLQSSDEKFTKFDTDKTMYNLVSPSYLRQIAEVLTFGANKYSPDNWANVDDNGRYVAALFRHIQAWREGEKEDQETGLHHLAHAATNLMFLFELDKRGGVVTEVRRERTEEGTEIRMKVDEEAINVIRNGGIGTSGSEPAFPRIKSTEGSKR